MYAFVDIIKNNSKVIVIIKPNKSILFKIVVITILVPLMTTPIGVILLMIQKDSFKYFLGAGALIFLLALTILMAIQYFKYFKRTFQLEKLIVDADSVTCINSLLGIETRFNVSIKEIKAFEYIGYIEKTKHPLEIKGDVLGFGISQNEVDFLIESGTLLFTTDDYTINFGLDVDEEDFVRIKHAIKLPLTN